MNLFTFLLIFSIIITKTSSLFCCDVTKEYCVGYCPNESSGLYTTCFDIVGLCNGTVCSDCGPQYTEYIFGCQTNTNWTCNTNCYPLSNQGMLSMNCTNGSIHNSDCDIHCGSPGFIEENFSKKCFNGKWSNTLACKPIDNYCQNNITSVEGGGSVLFSGNKIGSEAYVSCIKNQNVFTSICSNGSIWIPPLLCPESKEIIIPKKTSTTSSSKESKSDPTIYIAYVSLAIVALVLIFIFMTIRMRYNHIKKMKQKQDMKRKSDHSSSYEEITTENTIHAEELNEIENSSNEIKSKEPTTPPPTYANFEEERVVSVYANFQSSNGNEEQVQYQTFDQTK